MSEIIFLAFSIPLYPRILTDTAFCSFGLTDILLCNETKRTPKQPFKVVPKKL